VVAGLMILTIALDQSEKMERTFGVRRIRWQFPGHGLWSSGNGVKDVN